MAPSDIAQSLENLKLERDAITLYDALASIEKDERRASAFRTIAGNERRHAEIWATKLQERGAEVPPAGSPRLRVRFIILLARVFGTHAVSDLVQALEGDEEELYDAQSSPEVASIAADEREHAEIWRRLTNGQQGGGRDVEARETIRQVTAGLAASNQAASVQAASAPAASAQPASGQAASAQAGSDTLASLEIHPLGGDGRAESWHRTGQSGTFRAVIFGVSDGLVSNLSLVMGVAGATTTEPRFILLAGIAGLLAGAFSMAAGEFVSMQSQRELYERQIALERAELEMMPEEEEAELARLYRARGFSADEAHTIAHRIFRNPEVALETLIREELGLDPNELGSPWGAASGSFLAFAAGAAVPVVPYLFGGGGLIFAVSLGLSLLALFAVGAGVSLITGRGPLFSGARQVAIGAAAAAVTFAVGRLIGISLA
jgi:VIT1/CCC1 family predicted Fe2+/Mn2+ transporter/rubrerythrin